MPWQASSLSACKPGEACQYWACPSTDRRGAVYGQCLIKESDGVRQAFGTVDAARLALCVTQTYRNRADIKTRAANPLQPTRAWWSSCESLQG